MCGLAGILHTTGLPPPDAALAERMAAAITHRGPDGAGVGVFGRCALAHRRLAVIDPAGNAQPLHNEDGSVALAWNGEIYGFRSLRERLAGLGHAFRSTGDSEVVLRAYEQWGPDCVCHFRGMFAIAIADQRAGRLFLARDHFGIKPLWWSARPGQVFFASEAAALAVAGLCGRIDLDAIDLYLRFGYIPAPRSGFAGVAKLPPAHRLVIGFDGRTQGPERYWRWTPNPRSRSAAALVEEADAVIADSVAAHLVADVPVGVFLSGGIDSALVASAVARHGGVPAGAFTIALGGPDEDESPLAARVAAHLGLPHRSERVEADALELLPHLAHRYGEPFADSSAIPTWHLSRLARRTATVALSGDGGDEFFLGYDSYRAWWRWLEMPRWRRIARAAAHTLAPASRPARSAWGANWQRHLAMLTGAQRAALWKPELRPAEVEPWAFADALGEHPDPQRLPQIADIHTYLPGDILTKVDIAAMDHGLEVRTPLVDLRVAEFAASLPMDEVRERLPDGSWRGKTLLRRLLARQVPEAWHGGPKRGFAVPLERWLPPAGDGLGGRLADGSSPLLGLFEARALHRLVGVGSAAQRWQLLCLQAWLDAFRPHA
jgi:asparagine synthase (glutamine-hydrolysing)